MSSPDIVILGGGPIGLWTAIQTKIHTHKNVLVVEKYAEYKRAEIRLQIHSSSFSGIPDHEPLKELTRNWGNKLVPIKEIEEKLTKCAHDLGISILKGNSIDPSKLEETFPTAKVFIGADGARSSFRKEFFGDEYKFNTPLQYLTQVQYLIKTPKKEEGGGSFRSAKQLTDSYIKQKFAGHLITENIREQKNGSSLVTLRIFINEKTYREMAGATFSNPYYFEKDLDKIPDLLKDILIKWWGSNSDQEIVKDGLKNKMTVIPLASYAAKDVVHISQKKSDPEDVIIHALVGDASQAYPFFRAINNGFLLGTKLSQCIGNAFAALDKTALDKTKRASFFASHFNSYSYYSTFRAYMEYITAFVKNLFIRFSSFWLKTKTYSSGIIKLSEKQKYEYYEKGERIWENLSGVKPPAREKENFTFFSTAYLEKTFRLFC